MTVVQQPTEHGGDAGAVAEQFTPVFYGPIRCQERAGAFVAAHDDLQQFLGGGQRQLAHSQIVDDQQGHRREQFHVFLAIAIQRSVGACSARR